MADPVVSQVTAGSSSLATTTVSFSARPAGTLLLLSVSSDDYKTANPSGWTLVQEVKTYHGHTVWYKIAAGSETSVAYTIGSASRSAYLLLEASNVVAVTPLDSSAGVFVQSYATTYATPTTATTAGRRLAVGWIGGSLSGALIASVTGWTAGYAAIGSGASTTAPGEITAAASFVFDGGGTSAASTGTYNMGPEARSAITAIFKVATGSTPSTGSASLSATSSSVAAGKRTPKGAASASHASTVAATGKRSPRAAAAASAASSLSASGKRAPKGVATVTAVVSLAAAGVTPTVGAKTGSAALTATSSSSAAGKRSPRATTAVTLVASGAASGKRSPKANASVTSTSGGSATGKRSPKANASLVVASSSTAAGIAPAVGVNAGTAALNLTASISAAGKRTPKGTAALLATVTGSATGSAPSVGMNTGYAAVTFLATALAVGKRFPLGTATVVAASSGSAVGSFRPSSSATLVVTSSVTATGMASLGADVTVTVALMDRPYSGSITHPKNSGSAGAPRWLGSAED